MKGIFFVLSLFIVTSIYSQQSDLYFPLNMKKAYLEGSRDYNGTPGKNYWQNKPEYKLNIDFDPAQSLVDGNETILYNNNSPDTLKKIIITVLGDIYKKDNYVHDWGISRDDMNDGVIFEKISVDGVDYEVNGDKIRRYATNMSIILDNPVLPHSSAQLYIKWKYYMPKKLQIRAGDYGDSTFMVGYSYPKVAVYDDIDGWDNHIDTVVLENFLENMLIMMSM
ncbi:MAG: hypothetical protein R2771_09260 [Saprospiraceae bacterium]